MRKLILENIHFEKTTCHHGTTITAGGYQKMLLHNSKIQAMDRISIVSGLMALGWGNLPCFGAT